MIMYVIIIDNQSNPQILPIKILDESRTMLNCIKSGHVQQWISALSKSLSYYILALYKVHFYYIICYCVFFASHFKIICHEMSIQTRCLFFFYRHMSFFFKFPVTIVIDRHVIIVIPFIYIFYISF